VTLSRRGLLGLLLGAPLAVQACKRKPREVAGSLRGASLEVGHRLRAAALEQATGRSVEVEVAIVGAGAAGLSAAWRLERLGERRFVVLELEPQPGGTSAYGTDGVVPYPWGAHYVPLPRADNRALVTLLDELGVLETVGPDRVVPSERLLVRSPEERIWVGGRWYEGLWPAAAASAADRLALDRFERLVDGWVAFRDTRGRRAFTLPMSRCSDDAEVTALDRMSAAQWLTQHELSSPVLRWYLEYACRDDYGLSLSQTSAWALLFYFAARKPAPGVAAAPFATWPEGNGRLVRHLSALAGERLQTGRLVTSIVPREDAVELSAFDVSTRHLQRYVARYVIMAVPQFVAARIFRPWREHRPAHLAAFSYGAWLVANVHLKRRPKSSGFPFAWDNVLYDSPSLGYVVATHQQLDDFGPTVWTYYRPFADTDPVEARRRLALLDQPSIADAVLSDLERAHDNLLDCVERVDAWRWGHAMVRPTPGFVWSAARRAAAAPVGRVHFAHSDLSGIALFEEAQDRGVRAAEAVLRAMGREIVAL
jgi:monoamine oxidase